MLVSCPQHVIFQSMQLNTSIKKQSFLNGPQFSGVAIVLQQFIAFIYNRKQIIRYSRYIKPKLPYERQIFCQFIEFAIFNAQSNFGRKNMDIREELLIYFRML